MSERRAAAFLDLALDDVVLWRIIPSTLPSWRWIATCGSQSVSACPQVPTAAFAFFERDFVAGCTLR